MKKYNVIDISFMNWFRVIRKKLTIGKVNKMNFSKEDFEIFADTERFGL